MKNLLVLLLMMTITIAYSQEKETKSEKTFDIVFSGKIENPNSDKISIFGEGFKHELAVDEKGIFKGAFKINREGYYGFYDGAESSSIYLQEGFDLQLTLNTEKFDETIKYNGQGAEANNYLAKKYLIFEMQEMQEDKMFAQNEKVFLKANKTQQEMMQKELASLKKVNREFIETEKKEIYYNYLNAIVLYESEHRKLIDNPKYMVSEEFKKPLEKINYQNEDEFKNIDRYQKLVTSKLIVSLQNPEEMKTTLRGLNELKSEEMKMRLCWSIINLLSNPEEDNKMLYQASMEILQNEKVTSKIQSTYKSARRLKAGSPSPTFAYDNIDGKKITLDDLKGKYVYIDVWATWCGPCKAEIPHLKEVEKAYHGENIEFVSISIDEEKNKEKWMQMIKEKEMVGIQLLADKDWNSSFVEEYGINSIPRFILLDHKGNIISANAPRPSDPALKEMLQKIKI